MQILEIPAQVPPADLPTPALPDGRPSSDPTTPQVSYSHALAESLRGTVLPAGGNAAFALEEPGEFTSTVPREIVLAPPVLVAVVAFDARPAENVPAGSDVAAAPPSGLGELLAGAAASLAEPASAANPVSSAATDGAPPSVPPPDGLLQILAASVPVQVTPGVGAITPANSDDSAAVSVLPFNPTPVLRRAAPPGNVSPDEHVPRTSDQPTSGDRGSPPNELARLAARLSPVSEASGTAPLQPPAANLVRADIGSAAVPAAISTGSAGAHASVGQASEIESADQAQPARPQEATPTSASVSSSGSRLEPAGSHQRTTVLSLQTDPTEFADRLTRTLLDSHQAGRPLQVRLHPPELGVLQIELSSREGVFTARLEVESTAARQTILEQLPQLREAFAQTGHHVERIDVHLLERQDDRPQHGGERRQTSDGSNRDDGRAQRDPRSQHRSDEQSREAAPRPHSAARHLAARSAAIEQLDIQV